MLHEDLVNLVLIFISKTSFFLRKENATIVRLEYMRWVNDLDYFNLYPWEATLASLMRACEGHYYTLLENHNKMVKHDFTKFLLCVSCTYNSSYNVIVYPLCKIIDLFAFIFILYRYGYMSMFTIRHTIC